MELKAKVSMFKNKANENIKYFDFFVDVPFNGSSFPIKLKVESAVSKKILASALGIKLDTFDEIKKLKTVRVLGEKQKFTNDDGDVINYYTFYSEVPYDGDMLRIKLIPNDATAKTLIANLLGLASLTEAVKIPEATSGDMPF